MTSPARLLVVQHEDEAPAAWFGEWIEAAGVELVVRRGHRGDSIPDVLDGYDGLMVLGGAMGAYDDERSPWLTPTKQLIRTAVEQETRPFLGICLGHQLATVAMGGTVVRNPGGRALGLTPVRLTAAGEEDPLLGDIEEGARAVQWNDDIAATLPRGATQLAVAPDATVQAARFGPMAWGVQFHPEVSPEVFAQWGAAADEPGPTADDALAPTEEAVAQAGLEIGRAESVLRATWQPFALRFADLVDLSASTS